MSAASCTPARRRTIRARGFAPARRGAITAETESLDERMEPVFSLISPEKILALPWHVGVPGMALIAVFLWSAVKSALTMRPVKAITRIVLALAVAVILTQGGEAIATLVDGAPQS
jgi:hypothetical protein